MTSTIARDRDGSVLGEDVAHPPEPGHRCRDGWLSGPDDDQPRPCPTCRPWLTKGTPRPPTRAELDAARNRTAW